MNNASFGAYAAIVQSPAYRGDKTGTTLELLPDLLTGHAGPHLVAHADGVTVDHPQAVLVSDNPYGMGDLVGAGRRARLDTGVLGMVAVTVDDARQAVRLLRRQQQHGLTMLRGPGGRGHRRRARDPRRRGRRGAAAADAGALHRPPAGAPGPGPARASRGPARRGRTGTWRRSCGSRSFGPGRHRGARDMGDRDWTALREAGRELVVLDRAVYAAVHATPSPTLDHAVARLSHAADHSKIWVATAAALALAGGAAPPGRSRGGLAAVGVTSAVVNVGVKPSAAPGAPGPAGAPCARTWSAMPTSRVLPVRARRLGLRVLDRGGRRRCPSSTPSCASRRRRWPTPGCTPGCTTRGTWSRAR